MEVPATSANLGPGFDCFGLALDWRERVSLAVIERGYQIDVSGEGAAELPRDESHLIIRSALVGLADLGVTAPGLWLGCRNTIPHGRGLGSSPRQSSLAWWLQRTGPDTGGAGLAPRARECHRGSSRQCGCGGLWRLRPGVPGPDRVTVAQGHVDASIGAALFIPRRRGEMRRPAICSPDRAHTSMQRRTPAERLCWSTPWRLNRTCSTTPPATGCTRDIAEPRCPLVRADEIATRTGLAAMISGAGPSVLVLGRQADLAALQDQQAPASRYGSVA